MIPKLNYPNTFFSPTYPLGSKVTNNSSVSFAGVPKYEPDVYDASLRDESFKCSEDPKVGQRLNLKG